MWSTVWEALQALFAPEGHAIVPHDIEQLAALCPLMLSLGDRAAPVASIAAQGRVHKVQDAIDAAKACLGIDLSDSMTGKPNSPRAAPPVKASIPVVLPAAESPVFTSIAALDIHGDLPSERGEQPHVDFAINVLDPPRHAPGVAPVRGKQQRSTRQKQSKATHGSRSPSRGSDAQPGELRPLQRRLGQVVTRTRTRTKQEGEEAPACEEAFLDTAADGAAAQPAGKAHVRNVRRGTPGSVHPAIACAPDVQTQTAAAAALVTQPDPIEDDAGRRSRLPSMAERSLTGRRAAAFRRSVVQALGLILSTQQLEKATSDTHHDSDTAGLKLSSCCCLSSDMNSLGF
jgi:hypothetical protein